MSDRHIFSMHIGAKLLGIDVSTLFVENCAEIELAPSQNLDVGEVRMPKLIDRNRFTFELIGCLDVDGGRAGS